MRKSAQVQETTVTNVRSETQMYAFNSAQQLQAMQLMNELNTLLSGSGDDLIKIPSPHPSRRPAFGPRRHPYPDEASTVERQKDSESFCPAAP